MAFVFGLQTPWLIDFTKIFRLNESEAQKQRPCELLWMLRFDEKSVSNSYSISSLLHEVTEGKGRNPQLLSAFPRPPLLQVYSWDWENLLKNIFFRVFVSLFNYSTWNVVLVVYPLNTLVILSSRHYFTFQ